MNWIGSSLSRHRRGKGWKEDMAHQEEYFAKARTRQHDQIKSSPAVISAANFIPNYSAPSEAAPSEATGITSALRTAFSLPVLFTQPLAAADEASANLDAPPKDTQRDVADLPLLVLPRQTNGSAVLNNLQSANGHFICAPDPEAERRRLLRKENFTEINQPKLSVLEPIRRREHSTISRHISEPRRQPGMATGRCEMPSNVGRQRGNRKRRMNQIPSSPSLTLVRIQIGSQSYRWSEGGNSIRNPTYSDCSSNAGAEEIRCMPRNVSNSSHVTSESSTSFSSSTSPLPLSSPGNYRLSCCRKFSDLAQQVEKAALAGSQRPIPSYTTNKILLKLPSPVSEAGSTGSMVVEIGDDEDIPKIGMDEERIWRGWLNQDMPELWVPATKNKTQLPTL